MATIEEIAQSIIKEAEEKADEISKSYAAETKAALEILEKEHIETVSKINLKKAEAENAIKKKLGYDYATITSNAESKGKFEFFEEVIDAASEGIIAMPIKDYSLFLFRIITKKAPPQGAEIYLGKNDTKRLGKEFLQNILKSYDIKIKEGNELYGFIIQTPNYIDKVTPKTIVDDMKPELMQILGRYEASL